MCSRVGLPQLKFCAPANNLTPELYEMLQHFLQIQELRLAINDRDIDNAERRLHRRQLVKLVQDHLWDRVALELDHDTHSFAVRFITDLRYTLQLLFLNKLSDPPDQLCLIYLIRDLGDHDSVASTFAAADLVDHRPRTHLDNAAAGHVRPVNLLAAVDESRGREIRPRDDLY